MADEYPNPRLNGEEVLEPGMGRRLTDRFPSGIANCPLAIICVDEAKRIQVWNAAATTLYGFTEQEAIGQTLSLIIPSQVMSERAHDGLMDTFKASRKVSSSFGGSKARQADKRLENFRVLPANRKGGTIFNVKIYVFKLGNGWTGSVSEDVSAELLLIESQKKALAELARLKSDLEDAYDAKDEALEAALDTNIDLLRTQSEINQQRSILRVLSVVVFVALSGIVVIVGGQLVFEGTSEGRISTSIDRQANVALQLFGSVALTALGGLGVSTLSSRGAQGPSTVNQSVNVPGAPRKRKQKAVGLGKEFEGYPSESQNRKPSAGPDQINY